MRDSNEDAILELKELCLRQIDFCKPAFNIRIALMYEAMDSCRMPHLELMGDAENLPTKDLSTIDGNSVCASTLPALELVFDA